MYKLFVVLFACTFHLDLHAPLVSSDHVIMLRHKTDNTFSAKAINIAHDTRLWLGAELGRSNWSNGNQLPLEVSFAVGLRTWLLTWFRYDAVHCWVSLCLSPSVSVCVCVLQAAQKIRLKWLNGKQLINSRICINRLTIWATLQQLREAPPGHISHRQRASESAVAVATAAETRVAIMLHLELALEL